MRVTSKRNFKLKRWLSVLPFWCGCASIPGATGPHPVGTTRFDMRLPLGRRVEVRAWYPAQLDEAQRATHPREPYIEPALAAEMAETFGMPRFAFGQRASQAFIDAPGAPGRFPVLLFNHGFASFAKQNATQIEDLARHGFVVLSLNHPADSLLTTYDDGTTIAIDRSSLAYRDFEELRADPKPILELYREVFDALRQAKDDPQRHRELLRGLARSKAYASMAPIVTRWVEHTRALIDRLPEIDAKAGSPLAGHLAVSTIGLFGHSLGGIVMGRLAQLDTRVAAVVTYDAPQLDFTDPRDEPPRQRVPTCFLYADAVRMSGVRFATDAINDGLLRAAPAGSCSGLVRAAAHYNFSDMNNTPVLRWTPMLGSVDNREMAVFLREFTRGYFEHHISGAPRPQAKAELVELRWRE